MNHRIKDSSMYEVKLQVTRKFSSIEDDVRFSKKTRIFERSPLPEFQKSFLLLGDQLLLLRASFSLIESAFCPHAKNFISHSESSFGKPPADPFGALQLDLRTRDSREIDLFRIASGTARADNASALEERKHGKQERPRFLDCTRTSPYVSGTFAKITHLSTCGVFSAAIMNHCRHGIIIDARVSRL